MWSPTHFKPYTAVIVPDYFFSKWCHIYKVANSLHGNWSDNYCNWSDTWLFILLLELYWQTHSSLPCVEHMHVHAHMHTHVRAQTHTETNTHTVVHIFLNVLKSVKQIKTVTDRWFIPVYIYITVKYWKLLGNAHSAL